MNQKCESRWETTLAHEVQRPQLAVQEVWGGKWNSIRPEKPFMNDAPISNVFIFPKNPVDIRPQLLERHQ